VKFSHKKCFQSCELWIPFCIFCYVSHAAVSGTYPWVVRVSPSKAWSKCLITVGWVLCRHQMAPIFSLASCNPKSYVHRGFHVLKNS